MLGAVFLVAGMAQLATMTTTTGRSTTSIYMVLIGAGLGCTMQLATIIAQNSVQLADLGVASAAVTLFRTVGGSVGVALFGSLFTVALAHGLPTGTSQPTASQLAQMSSAARTAYEHAVTSGMQRIFTAGAVIAVAALIAALLIREVPLRGKAAAPAQPRAISAPQPITNHSA